MRRPTILCRPMGLSQAAHSGRGALPPTSPQSGSHCQNGSIDHHAQGITNHCIPREPEREERAELFARLRGFCHTEPSALACQADGRLHCLTQSSNGACNTAWASQPQGQDSSVGAPHPPKGKPCNTILDEFGRHAGLCNKGLHTRRHDLVRDHIAKVARQAGLTAEIEQKMLIPGQTQEDGEPQCGQSRRATAPVILV